LVDHLLDYLNHSVEIVPGHQTKPGLVIHAIERRRQVHPKRAVAQRDNRRRAVRQAAEVRPNLLRRHRQRGVAKPLQLSLGRTPAGPHRIDALAVQFHLGRRQPGIVA
jgi:hypothetical protein